MPSIPTLQAVRAICECRDWKVSNLQIQKILYLCHMYYMGYNSPSVDDLRPLIDEPFQAWMYGPVVPSVYRSLRRFGADYVEPTYALMCEDPLDEDTKQYEMINTVCEVTGAMPSHRLINLTHKLGGAWSQHYVPKRNTIIPNAAIYNELKNDEDRRKSKNVA